MITTTRCVLRFVTSAGIAKLGSIVYGATPARTMKGRYLESMAVPWMKQSRGSDNNLGSNHCTTPCR